MNDSTDKWTIEKYSYNSVTDSAGDTHDYVTDFSEYGINFSTDKCFFGYKKTSSSKYKTIITQKKDDYNNLVSNDLQQKGVTLLNEVNKVFQLNDFEETNRILRFPLMSDSLFITSIWANSQSQDKSKRIMYNGENLYTLDISTMETKQVALPYGKVIDYVQKSNGAFSCLFENQPFGKTVNFIPNWETLEFDVQETEAISEEVKDIQKMFADDIGEVYIEQADTDKIYLVGKSYDTSIKVQTVNGEKTIPTLDGMDELEQRVENIEKKVSSSENEMSLIETEINKVNENIEAVNANVESVGEQVAQWVLIGEVKQYFGATVPDKYLLCNGQEIAQADYPELYAVIGSLECCQSENEGMFKVPDLQGRFLQGANGNLGTVKEAGLPNITGYLSSGRILLEHPVGSGKAITSIPGTRYDLQTGTSANELTSWQLDASRSNAIYGKSDTVQPPAISVNYIIRAKI